MKKVFVFCVGGTGLRVMKSVTMLMAAGMDTNEYTVVPVKVDPHRDLDERKGLNSLLDDYIKIFNKTVDGGNQTLNPLKGFFANSMVNMSDLNNIQNDTDELGGEERRFGSYINAELPDDDINKFLVQTLYSQKNLTSKLSVGFKGNPNVGTVVLGDMIEGASWFESFKQQCNEEDRVFIISSIFGGTGASGYPLIEKKIRGAKDLPNLCNTVMGAVTVLPYFELDDPGVTNSDIDSTSFITKTKSALAYYENTVASDYLYYIGEKAENRPTYINNESAQQDAAHFIELVAASALFDFLKRERQDTTQYMSRTIREDKPSLDRSSLGDAYNDIVKHLADMSLLRLLVNSLPKENKFPLEKTRGFNGQFYQSEEYLLLQQFLNVFNNWYKELSTNTRAFAPFLIDESGQRLAEWVKGTSLAMQDDSYLLLEMIKASRSDGEKHSNRLRYLLKFAHEAIDKYTQVIK